MYKLILILLFLLLFLPAQPRAEPERYYQLQWCAQNNGTAEVVMADGTRCDCVTERYAVEFDFGCKWAEGISQALYYSCLTGKKPLLVLIVKDDGERDRYLKRVSTLVKEYDLPIVIEWIRGER